jgi:hypothetical protein
MTPIRKTVQKPCLLILEQELSLLSPNHQHTIKKILNANSIHIEKLISKVLSNDIQIDAPMLNRMLDHMHLQYHLPLQTISKEKLKEQLEQDIPIIPHPEQQIWFDILGKLDIWSNFMFHQDEIFYFLALSNSLLIQDKSPHFHVVNLPSRKTIFWKKKSELPVQATFSFIYEKFKFFHWDLIPNTKRPMDLNELFCLLEDAAIETNLIQVHPEYIDFNRALNASALIHSVLYTFPSAIPDYQAFQLEKIAQSKSYHLFNDSNLHDLIQLSQEESLYGRQHFLQNFNKLGFLMSFKSVIQYIIEHNKKISTLKKNPQAPILMKTVLNEILAPDFNQKVMLYTQNVSKRLVFIFNRMNTIGYLMRSPTLKSLGYHPLINSEIPIRFAKNLEVFMNHFKNFSLQTQEHIIQEFINYIHQDNQNLLLAHNQEPILNF